MKKKLSVLIIMALCLSMLSVSVEAKAKLSVTKSMSLTVGKSETIKVKGSYIKSKKYKTSQKKIATVSKKGDVTKNVKLTDLYCSENKLTSLDVSKNPELDRDCLECDDTVTVIGLTSE